MKKIILSATTVILFGVYSFFVRAGDISSQLNKNNPVPVEPAGTTVSDSGKVTKNSDCVYIPYQDNEDEEEYVDEETGEVKTKNGYYKCTTITVTPPTTTTPTPTPVVTTPPPVIKPKSNVKWKDGTFIGDSVDAYYGLVQVSATFKDDRLTSVAFLDYPQDRITSKQKAISTPSSNVDTVSGVTYTSEAFISSLTSAMSQAKI